MGDIQLCKIKMFFFFPLMQSPLEIFHTAKIFYQLEIVLFSKIIPKMEF